MRAVPIAGSNIVITGGAGLVGSHIADLCVKEGAKRITILDNFTRGVRRNLENALRSAAVHVVEGDIRDRAVVAEVMQGADIVFHQAAIRITQCAEEPRLAFDVLAGGTFQVLECSVAAGVKKVVAASSASIYGMADHFPTTERDHPYNNRTLYGAAKLFNESLLRSFHDMYALDYAALRYFNVYGPRMDVHGAYTEVLIRWMERIAAGKPPLIFGDGLQTMDFVHVEDIARANVLAATSAVSDEVFNIGSGSETSLVELAQALMKAMGRVLPIEYLPERKVNPVPRRLAATAKARELLGFEARIELQDGLEQLVAWWRAQQ